MFKFFTDIFCSECFAWATGPGCGNFGHNLTPVERWAVKTAKLATPGQLIAGHIVQSMLKDFDDWCVLNLKTNSDAASRYRKGIAPTCRINSAIHNSNKDLTFCYYREYDDYDDYEVIKNFHVNSVPISDADGRFIYDNYNELRKKIAKAKEIAAKAKRDMELNEDKWNLYEKIAGYRRNEHGALEPVDKLAGVEPVGVAETGSCGGGGIGIWL